MNAKSVVIIILVVLCVVGCLVFFRVRNNLKTVKEDISPTSIVASVTDPEKIPEGYIAVGHSNWSAEIGTTIYIYKLDNDQDNYGFEYITVSWSTKSWGSSEYDESIIEKGQLNWTDDVVEYIKGVTMGSGYISVPGEEKGYTFEEYSAKFIKN